VSGGHFFGLSLDGNKKRDKGKKGEVAQPDFPAKKKRVELAQPVFFSSFQKENEVR